MPNIDLVRWVVQYLHVLAAVLWVGGGFYTLFVQLPALLATPPEARGSTLAQLGPRQINYILRMAELTIVTGILSDRLEGTLACVAVAALAGAEIIRVHDVAPAVRVARMAAAIAQDPSAARRPMTSAR